MNRVLQVLVIVLSSTSIYLSIENTRLTKQTIRKTDAAIEETEQRYMSYLAVFRNDLGDVQSQLKGCHK